MATIHKRRLRSGEVVWELTHGSGTERQRFIAGRTREEALGILAQFKRQLTLHGAAPGDETLDGVVTEYRQYLTVNRRARTVIRYTGILRTFCQCFLKPFHPTVVRIRDVRPMHLEDYKQRRLAGQLEDVAAPEDLKREQALRISLVAGHTRTTAAANAKFGWLGRHQLRRKVSERTVNYELRTLFTFFQWAVRRNQLVINPSQSVERLRVPERALPKFLTSADLQKFFAACTPRERRLFMSILLTGMRKGEVEHLSWDDVSFELGVIFIREKPDIGWKPKTDERIIPISPVLHDLLVAQFAQRTSERWVFANEAGNRDGHMLEKLKAVCRRAGIKAATVHALRHSFGAHLRMAGVSLADIADLLGHKDLATTQIYAKVQQEHLRKVVAKLAPLVSSSVDSGEAEDEALRTATHLNPAKEDNRKLLKG